MRTTATTARPAQLPEPSAVRMAFARGRGSGSHPYYAATTVDTDAIGQEWRRAWI